MQDIIDVFEALNRSHIKYVVLRGYDPIDELFSSKDIDVYVSKHDMQSLRDIFEKLGFRTPRINACAYPHVQFFKLRSSGMIKFDIVTELCYGAQLLTIANGEEVLKKAIRYEFINVLPPEMALILLLIHILLDKGCLSEENRLRVICVYKKVTDKKLIPWNEKVKEFCYQCLNGKIEDTNEYIKINQAAIISEVDFLDRRKNVSRLNKITNRNVKWRYRFHRVHRRTIALLGVDGSGKSTTIKALEKTLGDGCYVQYMGFREMETKWGKEWYASGKRYKLKFIPFLGVYMEMWYRYLKYRFKNGRIILFDRFPWEAFDNGTGKYKVMYFILFKVFFPRPKKVYYLHCPDDTSLKRKDDITNEQQFKNMKKRFDSTYMNMKNIISFDTDVLDTSQIVEQICDDIMASGFYEYMF